MSCSHDASNFLKSAQQLHALTRRQFFQECGIGVGKIALASLLAGGLRTVSAAEVAAFRMRHAVRSVAPEGPEAGSVRQA